MKSTRKVISVILTVLMLMSCVSVSLTVNASTGTLSDYYATNPSNKVGVQKTITIDGNASDWSEDMLIAQGAAWDVANHYKGGHENCVLDTYALFASWDNDNLYVGWQMVNTTDTWAREGDGPLSDGGRVLDVPLILALSVDPSSTSMSNKNTSGGSIWGQKMGLEFDQHVDHLLYMSGKPGNGDPAIFTAVDSQGNTDYDTGCELFKSAGIEYKMAETNICSSIYGLNYSEDTSDVYSNDADWVDYKTFSGSMGTHDTSYDSFYEIKIPLSVLGIDASYIQNNGIGAMLVATRGESGLDCIPFDDTMLDNATGSYSNDASTSAEKDDIDTITSSFARIGNIGGDQPITQPTTVAPTTEPVTTAPVTTVPATTAPVTTEPASDTLTVNATSNLFTAKTLEASENAETVTVSFDLESAMNIVNGQWTLKYDTSKLSLKSDSSTLMPYISDGVINVQDGVIKGNFTNVSDLYDFTSEKSFVQATFDIIGTGTTEVNLEVQELSVGYTSDGVLNYRNAVVNSVEQDLSGETGFTSSSISGTANVVADQTVTTVPSTDPTTPEDSVNIYGDINLDLTSDDATTYTGSVDLDAGTYTFRVSENGTAMCNGSSFTDVIYNIPYYSEFKAATTLNVSGGRYTFSYNASANSLTVKYKPYSDLVEIFGDINVELVKGSGTVFTGSARLEAGSYDFRINEMGTQMCFGYTFDDHVYKIVYNADWTSATTFNANGGLYSFKYDTATNELTVQHAAEGVGDVRIFGDLELNLIKDYGTLYSATTTLTAGTYQFRVDELGTTYCNGSTFTESIYQIGYSSDWKSATTFNVEDGKYTFRYDTSTHKLTVLYSPLEQKVSIFGDIELELTNTTGTLYSGKTTLEAGTYAFRVDEFGVTMCFGGTYTDTMSYVTYSKDFSSATTFNATGGEYTFTYNAETNRLSIAYASA